MRAQPAPHVNICFGQTRRATRVFDAERHQRLARSILRQGARLATGPFQDFSNLTVKRDGKPWPRTKAPERRKLYDGTGDEITLDEVERIAI